MNRIVHNSMLLSAARHHRVVLPLSTVVILPQQHRSFHVSRYQQRQDSSLLFGLAGVAVAAYGGGMLLESAGKYIAARNAAKSAENSNSESSDGTSSSSSNSTENDASSSGTNANNANVRGGFFASFFQTSFYEGGFEETMTRREAALILGIRESTTKEKVVQAHRKLSLINHPDKGGSPYIAQKVNEAKEVLLGTRR